MSSYLLDKCVSWYPHAYTKKSNSSPPLGNIFNDIMSGYYKNGVEKIRAESDKASRAALKRKIPCFTPSGIFANNERDDAGLVGDFTGLIVLDLDRKGNEGIDLNYIPDEVMTIPYTFAVHRSVGGDGYAIYVRVNRWAENTYSFAKLYYEILLNINLDKATSNLSRLRYVSYDPDLRLSEGDSVMEIPVVKFKEKVPQKPDNSFSEEDETAGIWRLAKRVIQSGSDPTSDYQDWFRIGVALAGLYGENGRKLFHYISGNYHSYSYKEADRKYDYFIRLRGYKVTKGTIIYILSQYQ